MGYGSHQWEVMLFYGPSHSTGKTTALDGSRRVEGQRKVTFSVRPRVPNMGRIRASNESEHGDSTWKRGPPPRRNGVVD